MSAKPLIFVLLIFVCPAHACLPKRNILPQKCEQKSDNVLFFVHNDVKFFSESDRTCKTCASGSERYYAPASVDTPYFYALHEAAGFISAKTCPNFCICSTGDCYRPTSSDVMATFWPYCSNGKCGMHVYILADSDDSGLASTTSYTVYKAGDQMDSMGPKPVTDSSYIKAQSVGCDVCLPFSCPKNAPILQY